MIDALQIFDGTISAAGIPTGGAITGSRTSANVLDLVANRDYGGGMGVALHCNVTQAFVGGTSLQVVYQTSADNATFVDVLLSPVIQTANLTAGARVFRVLSPQVQLNDLGTPNRFHRLNFIVAGTFTAGAIFAYLNAGNDRDRTQAYPAAYSVTA